MSPVPNKLLDTDRLPLTQRLPALQQITAPIYEVHPIGDPDALRVYSQSFRVGDLLFHDIQFSPARFRRGRRHLRGRRANFLVLHEQLEGEETLVMAHKRLRLVPGHVYLRDWAQEYGSVGSAMRLRSIVIPRHYLTASATLSTLNPVLSLPLSEPAGRMIAANWSQLLTELPSVSLAQAQTLCEALMAALDALWGVSTDSARKPTLGAIQQFLAARLMGSIEVEDICRQFQLSRSTLYRLFQPLGGVRHYISRARLERCYSELWRADPAATQVGDIASSWGFAEPSAFTRSFRAHFGVPPSRVLGEGHRQDDVRQLESPAGLSSPQTGYMLWLKEASGLNPH